MTTKKRNASNNLLHKKEQSGAYRHIQSHNQKQHTDNKYITCANSESFRVISPLQNKGADITIPSLLTSGNRAREKNNQEETPHGISSVKPTPACSCSRRVLKSTYRTAKSRIKKQETADKNRQNLIYLQRIQTQDKE